MPNGLQLPDIEVLVRAAAWDVAVISFWKGETSDDPFDILCGVAGATEAALVVTALQQAIEALRSAHWQPVSSVDDAGAETKSEPPF